MAKMLRIARIFFISNTLLTSNFPYTFGGSTLTCAPWHPDLDTDILDILQNYNSTSVNEILEELDQQIEGSVHTDTLFRMLYATDASPYQQLPLAIVRPHHAKDCIEILTIAARHKLPVIPRAAGTSLAGQCVGKGLIVDFAHNMNQIISIDSEQCTATIEPGVVRDTLNDEIRPLGLMFAPDPSTSSRCTLGGMVGNNAWGIHSLRYGATRENILRVEVVLSDGTTAVFEALDHKSLQMKLGLTNLEGEIYRAVYKIIDGNLTLIEDRFPAPDGIPRNAGYPLDILIRGRPWVPSGPMFNLAPFICGTEGTLALTTAIQVKLVPIPQNPVLLCVHFQSIDEALQSVSQVLCFQPAALEIIDQHILERTKQDLEQRNNRFWLRGNPAAVLLVEFHGDYTIGAKTNMHAIEKLQTLLPAYAFTIVKPPRLEQVWALRRAGLGLLMGIKGPNKAVTGIEDTAVPTAVLPDYVREIKTILSHYDTDCVVYGPAGRGNLHLRPEVNLNQESGRRKYLNILDEVSNLVIQFGGTISAKHGDGRLRAYYLEPILGKEVLQLLRSVKNTFDPSNIFNPNKILDTLPPNENLRNTSNQIDSGFQGFFDWTHEYGFKEVVQKCNGAGVCLKRSGTGTMCPSYRVTGEEKHGTRGRANIVRQLVNSQGPEKALSHEYVKEVLDLCLACKGCKSECPADVDMARIKSEFLQQYNAQHWIPLRNRIVGHFDRLSRCASYLPSVSNTLLAQSWVKTLLGFHPQRHLPRLASQKFSQWLVTHKPSNRPGGDMHVVLILDPFSEYFEPNVAIAAILVLERLNFRVTVTPCMSFGRSQLSQGFLRHARKLVEKAIDILEPFAKNGSAIIGLEPSELLTLRDEAPDLFKERALKKRVERISARSFLFDEFIAQQTERFDPQLLFPKSTDQHFVVHGHCHQKSLVGMQPTQSMLSLIPNTETEIIASGCCGMAGAFGYKKEHFDISQQIAELELFPAIRKSPNNSLIVAAGTSCRHQISDGLGVTAFHPAEVFAMAMGINVSHSKAFGKD